MFELSIFSSLWILKDFKFRVNFSSRSLKQPTSSLTPRHASFDRVVSRHQAPDHVVTKMLNGYQKLCFDSAAKNVLADQARYTDTWSMVNGSYSVLDKK